MKQEKRRKNAIWIFGDQHRGQALGCNGDPNVATPNIDILASSGVNFINAYASFPLCCPSRASMITGKFAHRCVPGHEYQLSPSEPTIADVFNKNGYETMYIGKWHLDGFKEIDGRAAMHLIPPPRRGRFQYWLGYENNNSQWDSWVHGGEADERSDHHRLPGYETDELTTILIDRLNKRYSRKNPEEVIPFFAVLSVQPPHDPYVAPAEFMQWHVPGRITLRKNVPEIPRIVDTVRRDLAGYYAMIENLDWNVGRIRDALLRLGIAEDTYVFFFSDHGDMHGSHGQFRKSCPYEESVKVPLIISGGESAYYTYYNQKRYGVCSQLFSLVDLAPTTLGLCGLEIPDGMDGRDLSWYKDESRPHADKADSVFLESVISTETANHPDKPWRGIVTSDGWKYACFEKAPWLMFNLNEDPFEFVNLAHNNDYKAMRTKLEKRLQEWIRSTGDDFSI